MSVEDCVRMQPSMATKLRSINCTLGKRSAAREGSSMARLPHGAVILLDLFQFRAPLRGHHPRDTSVTPNH